MRSDNYLLHPSALEKLRDSGIEEKISRLKESGDLPYIGGHVFESDVVSWVKELAEERFYRQFPQGSFEKYKANLNGLFQNPQDFNWRIQRPEGEVLETCDLNDILLFSGILASYVLSPEEVGDYSKFGFSSPQEFFAVVGELVKQRSRGQKTWKDVRGAHSRSYIWIREGECGAEIVTEITGSEHGDLRIYQTDISPYPAIAPFGNPIRMKPITDEDRSIMAPHHSTEGSMLVAVMRYVEQQDIDLAEFGVEGIESLVEFANSLNPGIATCGEHTFPNGPMRPSHFVNYRTPIPQLDGESRPSHKSIFSIFADSDRTYLAYIATNGDLVFSLVTPKNVNDPRRISVRFPPGDAKHLIKGLIQQATKYLGRTSPKELFSILRYRHSKEFEESEFTNSYLES